MGTQNKKIGEVLSLAKKGKIDDAKEVIHHHIEACHSFETDLSGLHTLIGDFKRSLEGMKEWIGVEDRFIPKNAKEAIAATHAKVEDAKAKLPRAKALLRKLVKDMREKIE